MKGSKNLHMMIMNIMMIPKILKIKIIIMNENKIYLYLYLYLFEINEFHPNKQYYDFLANKQNFR